MRCIECDDGGKMPLDAKLSVGIAWCPTCTACIRYDVAVETLKTWPQTPDVIRVLESAAQNRDAILRASSTKLHEAVELVIATFEKDEAQGYRSKDRQFAISILSAALSRS